MTLEELIQASLNPLASGGAHLSIAPQGTPTPYIVWTLPVSVVNNTLDGQTDLQNTLLQVDVYAAKYLDARPIADACTTALGAAVTTIKRNDQTLFEQDTRKHRILIEYSIWSTL